MRLGRENAAAEHRLRLIRIKAAQERLEFRERLPVIARALDKAALRGSKEAFLNLVKPLSKYLLALVPKGIIAIAFSIADEYVVIDIMGEEFASLDQLPEKEEMVGSHWISWEDIKKQHPSFF